MNYNVIFSFFLSSRQSLEEAETDIESLEARLEKVRHLRYWISWSPLRKSKELTKWLCLKLIHAAEWFSSYTCFSFTTVSIIK